MIAHASDEVVACSLLCTSLPLEAADAVTTTWPPCSSQAVLAPAITSVVLRSEKCNDDAKKNFCFYHNWAYRDSPKQWQLLRAKVIAADARGREKKEIKGTQWSHVERLPWDRPGCQLLHGITWIWMNSQPVAWAWEFADMSPHLLLLLLIYFCSTKAISRNTDLSHGDWASTWSLIL